MKIGYPCINTSIGCTSNSTFRLANYSEENLIGKVANNLGCLQKILEYNVTHGLLFFRISSDIVPFASHPVCEFDWQSYFKKELRSIGSYIKKNGMRISMHPDQFVLINSPNKKIVESSIRELSYHCDVLDLMGLDETAKVQIHVGGVYGDRESAIGRFVSEYRALPAKIKKRLAIENDDRSYPLADCLAINKETGIPVLFDSFHHECLNRGEQVEEALKSAAKTWKEKDGLLMTDYSSQAPNARKGSHVTHIDLDDFKRYLKKTMDTDFDIMLEIKDKEKSALEAVKEVKRIRK